MTETIFFCVVIFIIIAFGFFGIINANKSKSYGFTRQNTDTVRGFAICMIAASHIAQFTRGGIANYFVFLWGGMGVAVFFTLSGYGNYFSIQKATDRFKWLIKRIIQILVPFIFCFIYVSIAQIVIFRNPVSLDYLKNFFTLSIPGTTTWYFKIQILLYALLALAVIINRDKSHYILCGLVVVYIVTAYFINMDDYWYMTSLCFPLGYMIGKYKDKFTSGWRSLPFLIISGCLFVAAFIGYIKFSSIVLQITYFLLLALTVASFLVCFGLSSKFMAFIGKHSVYVYLIHIGMAEPCYDQISNIWIATGFYVFMTALGSVICRLISKPLNSFLSEHIIREEK